MNSKYKDATLFSHLPEQLAVLLRDACLKSSSNQQSSPLRAAKRATTKLRAENTQKGKLQTELSLPSRLVTARYTWELQSDTLQSDSFADLTHHGCSAINFNAVKGKSKENSGIAVTFR